MNKSAAVAVGLLWVGLWTAMLAGCTPSRYADPVAVMLDRQTDYSRRRTAARQAHEQLGHDPKLRDALHTIVFSTGYPPWQRIEALDMMVELDEAALRRDLAVNIMSVPDRLTLQHVYDLAVTRRWDDFTPLAVRCYARPDRRVPVDQRPERRVIEQLNPGRSVQQVLADVFRNPDGSMLLVHQTAAWALLCQLGDRPRCLALLAAARAHGDLARELSAAWNELHVLPGNRDEVLWLLYLRDPQRTAWWSAAAAVVAGLDEVQRDGLELRHLPVLMSLDETTRSLTRQNLLSDLVADLQTAEQHSPSTPTSTQPRTAPTDGLGSLTWADAQTVQLLRRALRTPSVVEALFHQADADLADTATEYGGVIEAEPTAGFQARPFKPVLHRGDRAFVPSHPMIRSLYTGLFHYHFHVQDHDNAPYAGPGQGDRSSAEYLRFNFVVFTFIDQNRLNVDYYQPDGLTIDLGVIPRPSNTKHH